MNLREWSSQIKIRDGSCRECGSSTDLHAHHIKPRHSHPELKLDLDNGITLCKSCHAKAHDVDVAKLILFKPSNRVKKAESEASRIIREFGYTKTRLASELGFKRSTLFNWDSLPRYVIAYLELQKEHEALKSAYRILLDERKAD